MTLVGSDQVMLVTSHIHVNVQAEEVGIGQDTIGRSNTWNSMVIEHDTSGLLVLRLYYGKSWEPTIKIPDIYMNVWGS